MDLPFNTSGVNLSTAANTNLSKRALRAPILNPYDKFTKPDFDAWIGDLTGALRRALGREQEPDSLPPVPREALPEQDKVDVARLAEEEEEDVEQELEDSFAEIRSRRKGKARDPREGPGLPSARFGQPQPIELISESESEEEATTDEYIYDEAGDSDDAVDLESEDDSDLSGVHMRTNGEGSSGQPIEVVDDDEVEYRYREGPEEEDIYTYAEPKDEKIKAAPLPRNSNVFDRDDEGEDLSLDRHSDSSVDQEQNEEQHDVFPPRRRQEDLPEISDPWAGPRLYAEDFYAGGDRIRQDARVDPSSLTPPHEEDDHGRDMPLTPRLASRFAEEGPAPEVIDVDSEVEIIELDSNSEEGVEDSEEGEEVEDSDSEGIPGGVARAIAEFMYDEEDVEYDEDAEYEDEEDEAEAFAKESNRPSIEEIDDDEDEGVENTVPENEMSRLLDGIPDAQNIDSDLINDLYADLDTNGWEVQEPDHDNESQAYSTPSVSPPAPSTSLHPASFPPFSAPGFLPRAQERTVSSVVASNGHVDWTYPPAFPVDGFSAMSRDEEASEQQTVDATEQDFYESLFSQPDQLVESTAGTAGAAAATDIVEKAEFTSQPDLHVQARPAYDEAAVNAVIEAAVAHAMAQQSTIPVQVAGEMDGATNSEADAAFAKAVANVFEQFIETQDATENPVNGSNVVTPEVEAITDSVDPMEDRLATDPSAQNAGTDYDVTELETDEETNVDELEDEDVISISASEYRNRVPQAMNYSVEEAVSEPNWSEEPEDRPPLVRGSSVEALAEAAPPGSVPFAADVGRPTTEIAQNVDHIVANSNSDDAVPVPFLEQDNGSAPLADQTLNDSVFEDSPTQERDVYIRVSPASSPRPEDDFSATPEPESQVDLDPDEVTVQEFDKGTVSSIAQLVADMSPETDVNDLPLNATVNAVQSESDRLQTPDPPSLVEEPNVEEEFQDQFQETQALDGSEADVPPPVLADPDIPDPTSVNPTPGSVTPFAEVAQLFPAFAHAHMSGLFTPQEEGSSPATSDRQTDDDGAEDHDAGTTQSVETVATSIPSDVVSPKNSLEPTNSPGVRSISQAPENGNVAAGEFDFIPLLPEPFAEMHGEIEVEDLETSAATPSSNQRSYEDEDSIGSHSTILTIDASHPPQPALQADPYPYSLSTPVLERDDALDQYREALANSEFKDGHLVSTSIDSTGSGVGAGAFEDISRLDGLELAYPESPSISSPVLQMHEHPWPHDQVNSYRFPPFDDGNAYFHHNHNNVDEEDPFKLMGNDSSVAPGVVREEEEAELPRPEEEEESSPESTPGFIHSELLLPISTVNQEKHGDQGDDAKLSSPMPDQTKTELKTAVSEDSSRDQATSLPADITRSRRDVVINGDDSPSQEEVTESTSFMGDIMQPELETVIDEDNSKNHEEKSELVPLTDDITQSQMQTAVDEYSAGNQEDNVNPASSSSPPDIAQPTVDLAASSLPPDITQSTTENVNLASSSSPADTVQLAAEAVSSDQAPFEVTMVITEAEENKPESSHPNGIDKPETSSNGLKRKRRSSLEPLLLPESMASKNIGESDTQSLPSPDAKVKGRKGKAKSTLKHKGVDVSGKGGMISDTGSSSSGARSVASQLLKTSSQDLSRASSVGSSVSSHLRETSPTIRGATASTRNKPARPDKVMYHHHGPPQLPPARKQPKSETPAPPPSPVKKERAEPSTSQSNPPIPTYYTSPVTRSHCRFHRISLPREEGGLRVHFIVPGCSLTDRELIEENEIADHGDATMEEYDRMIPDVESLDFSAELLSTLRSLVGVDIIRQIYFLPPQSQETDVSVPVAEASGSSMPKGPLHEEVRRKSRRVSRNASAQGSREPTPSGSARAPAAEASKLSRASSLTSGPPSSKAGSSSSIADSLTRSVHSLSTASLDSQNDVETVDEGRLPPKRRKYATLDIKEKRSQDSRAENGQKPSGSSSTQIPSEAAPAKTVASQRLKPRRSKRLSADASAYKPEEDVPPDDSADEDSPQSRRKKKRSGNGKRGTKRARDTADNGGNQDIPEAKKARVVPPGANGKGKSDNAKRR